MAIREPFHLPSDLRLGVATSATQIEGGDRNNSWADFCLRPGVIQDGSTCVRANQHYVNFRQDISLMAEMGITVYRLGIEWSRIEPEYGVFSETALEHYREELALLREKGMEPLVTLHHFTNPRWFEDSGGFLRGDAETVFCRFVKYVVEGLGDLCCEYVTINEPNVYASGGYVFGEWPPGEKRPLRALKVMKKLALCHVSAYQLIHRLRKEKGYAGETKVGLANHLRLFVPYQKKNPLDRWGAKLLSALFQDRLTEAMMLGKFSFPFGRGTPRGEGKFYDFIGINYYSRSAVHWFNAKFLPDTPKNDLGWEIYPEGIAEIAKQQFERYQAPIWITENGVCDKKDQLRPAFLYDHLKQLTQSGVPVERYYHWTFLDNFEWAQGEAAPFGLVACDFETQKRVIKESGRFYQDIIRQHGITVELLERYGL